ncbi:hypothetical protein BT93_L2538 [Corymbia citriodora subsp. variegata]|uniref:TIR domain-containing protein n=1 Tax=Corymbia citriodora subsp. variegata TaxID=360336 RepID=A0A8T0CJL4_CORYI|nr:hypothetical protein BT93_L2538 [Corymbia citriodora subsp. variegata]
MASSFTKPKRSYHVFLSFRGPDVRNNFLGHLYTALDQAGIYTYIDNEELRKGEHISHTLMDAIEDSQIAVIIFSEDYASSWWCLKELTKIMECRKHKDLMVWPVFFKVEPCEVRTPRKSYREALNKHEVKFGKDSEEVKRWKKALFDASFLSGWHFTDGYEAVLVQQIVQKISTQLGRTPLDVTKYPVGIDSRVRELKSILNLQSKDDVLMVGFCGQGGVGKTTLAKAIYNAIFTEFQVSCFLECIKENSNDLAPLQEKLLSELLLGNKLAISNIGKGSQLIQERLCNKKVLIILDDVNDRHQLDALVRDCEWFGKGSRIIITTRNRRLVISHWVDSHRLYEVKALQDGEALELFRRHASLSNQKIEMRRNLVDRVLHYAKGLPLALRVLGCSLCERGEKEWEETLKKLAESPNQEINDVLRISCDQLEENEKQIFLDIACFFKGQSAEYITKVLSSCGFYMTIGLRHLIELSLISEERGTLQMHDLIQSMGMDIVKREYHDDPEKRSRLWLLGDVLEVLSKNGGTNAIKAIVLMLPKPEKMHIGPHAFTNMRKLRLLILHNVDNSFQGPIHLPDELRWFEWPNCASIPEFSDGPKKLIGLDLQNTNINVVLKHFKDFEKLKFINFSKCQWLVGMPDLNCTPNLKELDLSGCKNLEWAHESIACHGKLQLLNFRGCSKLQRFPNVPYKNKSLREVNLENTSIEELPASIENLLSLERMYLRNCKKLAILPSSIYNLQNLKWLLLSGCSKLIKFPRKEEDSSDPRTNTGLPMLSWLELKKCHLPEVEFLENLSCFVGLRSLDLTGNNFTNLPTCEKLYGLLELIVSNCQQLQEIPKIPRNLRRLDATNCESLSRIPSNIYDVEIVELCSCQELIHNGLSVNDWIKLEKFHHKTNWQVILPGEEMPKWLLPNKNGYISFVASKDLYKKILGVAFCVVYQVKGDGPFCLELTTSVNCKCLRSVREFKSVDLEHVWLEYMESKKVWTVDNFGPNDSSHICFSIRLFIYDTINIGGRVIVKKCGFRLISEPLENDLEVLLQDDQLIDPALLYEVSHEDIPMSTEEESSSEAEGLQDSETCKKNDGLNMNYFSIEVSLSLSQAEQNLKMMR